MSVPQREKGFYKFWWNQELDLLKDNSISSQNLWKTAGKPRSGPCFDKYRSDKLAYKLLIRQRQQEETHSYTNDLHEALLNKEGSEFWKCWRSKLCSASAKHKPIQVDGLTKDCDIANLFSSHFQNVCKISSPEVNNKLQEIYKSRRSTYNGLSFTSDLIFDAECVEKIVCEMKRGKAAGLDGITVEHLVNCHPCLPTLLAKLFNLIFEIGKVPDNFGLSYTVPLLKGNNTNMSKSLTANDFRGISISPVLSKVFENCVLLKYVNFFHTSDNQFGFKKHLSCSHAIYSVRQSVENFVRGGSTVNLCALDLSKAFDKLNHFGLFVKLMDVSIPNALLLVLENWFSKCLTCVRFGSAMSVFVYLECGVRQGGVLSPHLFAIYIDDVINKVAKSNSSCFKRFTCISIFVYADDIILLSPSVSFLQELISLVEEGLTLLDMRINAKKSNCIRFGPRYDVTCSTLKLLDGSTIPWANKCLYLGKTLLGSKSFKCEFENEKKSLYRSFNAIFGRIGRIASADVVLHLLKTKCLPAS